MNMQMSFVTIRRKIWYSALYILVVFIVTGKGQIVTIDGPVISYGQKLTLFCQVDNCCDKSPGWEKWEPDLKSLFYDVGPAAKYSATVRSDGFTLDIKNLTKDDLNKNYSCTYGFARSNKLLLSEENVFQSQKITIDGPVANYGQNLRLFCQVDNCCDQLPGWEKWEPSLKTIISNVRNVTFGPTEKYSATVRSDGYTLVIKNLTKDDLNKSYSCTHRFVRSNKLLLSEENVFRTDNQDSDIKTTSSRVENNVVDDTGLSTREIFFYSLLGTGLALVLCLSIGCNICINRKCRSLVFDHIEKTNGDNTNIVRPEDNNVDVNVSGVVEDIASNYPHYETIDESKMIQSVDVEINMKCFPERKDTRLDDRHYLEVIPDGVGLTECHKIMDPRCLKGHRKNRQDQCSESTKSSPRETKTEIIRNIVSGHTGGKQAEQKYNPICNNSSISNSSSSESETVVREHDQYLNPYVPLDTNQMEYLHSYSTPIRKDNEKTNVDEDHRSLEHVVDDIFKTENFLNDCEGGISGLPLKE